MFSFLKPLRKYEDFVQRAVFYDLLFLRKKAINIMKKAISLPFTHKEIASGHVYLGLLSLKTKDHLQALESFDTALEMVSEEKIYYNNNMKTIIETYMKYGDRKRGLYWLNHLLERQEYDKRFRKLEIYKDQF
ncbi:hypothetical protein GE107_18715 [Cohnella sp. CFH 77786]|uniref:hypothetical protein n=1 Tax=Cohnella sp. CFH 77786 TaxID=2662265 RepID=UPI001C608626|nr:hypothetical protein [Cohnella sp. CFH 77786]MBW5448093.1 hypothetical protein [Cohnella sp. CFH 77786]